MSKQKNKQTNKQANKQPKMPINPQTENRENKQADFRADNRENKQEKFQANNRENRQENFQANNWESRQENFRANNRENRQENFQTNNRENRQENFQANNRENRQENFQANNRENRQENFQANNRENRQENFQANNRENRREKFQAEKQENKPRNPQSNKQPAKQAKARTTEPTSKLDLFKPTIVLTCVTTIVAILLVATHQLTYVDTSNMITDKLKSALTEVMGEGEYSIVSDWSEYGAEKPENVEKLIKKSDGSLAFEIVTDGYSKKGIDLVVAMNGDGTVKGVSVVSLGETPGLGTNVKNESFLSQFIGKKGELSIVKNAPSKDSEVQGVTGATYSSKGVAKAVNIAIDTYGKLKGSEGEVK